MPFGSKRDESYPPSVRLPNEPLRRYGAPAVYPNERLGISDLFRKVFKKLSEGLLKSEKLVGFGPRPSWPKEKSFDVIAGLVSCL